MDKPGAPQMHLNVLKVYDKYRNVNTTMNNIISLNCFVKKATHIICCALFCSRRKSVTAFISQVRESLYHSYFTPLEHRCFTVTVMFLKVFSGLKEMDSLKKELEEELKLSTEDLRSHAWYHGQLQREVCLCVSFTDIYMSVQTCSML